MAAPFGRRDTPVASIKSSDIQRAKRYAGWGVGHGTKARGDISRSRGSIRQAGQGLGPQLAMQHSKGSGRQTCEFSEAPTEVTLICESGGESHLCRRQVGLHEQVVRPHEPSSHDVPMRCEPDRAKEGSREVRRGNSRTCSEFRNVQSGIQMGFDILLNAPQNSRCQSALTGALHDRSSGTGNRIEAWPVV